jgi:2-polyprenyl-3-methyl-5-hydroxy-6-metoxy-1,4-benzoquinol methylase
VCQVHALSWNHNAYYHPLLLRYLPLECDRVLDVGCGTGDFASQLARQAAHVDALDRSPVMIETARRTVPGNVICIEADVLDPALHLGPYDAITSISTLHHMPLPSVLRRLASWLRPGGVLAAIAVSRTDLPRELPNEARAVVFTNARGLALATTRLLRGKPRPVGSGPMPVQDPELTFRQAHEQARTALPEAHVRRLLLWRYLLVWHKPYTR